MGLADERDTEPALDAYSRVVTSVAAELAPHVAALEVSGPGGRGGAGSGVVVSDDGLLLTNAHVLASATGGAAGVRDRAATAGGARRRHDAAGRPVGGRGGQPVRPGRLGDRRGGQRAGPVAAHPRRADG